MWTLSGFVDEISPDFTEQCRVAAGLGLRYVELRSAWDVNILDLKPQQLTVMKGTLADFGLQVSSIGSPIGKIFIDAPFPPHLERMRHAAEVAHIVDAPYIRIFSFFLRPGVDPADYRDAVIDRMRALTRVAEAADVILLHENEKEIYGDVPARCVDLLTGVGSPDLRAAWDAANFVQCGVSHPFTEGFDLMKSYIEYVHVKDALADTGKVVPAGQGQGQIPETLSALRDSAFDGFFSLEPHLASSETYSGFSGPVLFRKAARVFKDLLVQRGIGWA